MANLDEPLFERDDQGEPLAPDDPPLRDRVRRLMETEDHAVLCTQGNAQPYGSLVAFAATPDLKHVAFATPITTRKYRLLSDCPQVALVCDDRAANRNLMRIEAVTATGRAHEISKRDDEFARWRDLLTGRHPYLRDLVAASTSALFKVEVVRYFHVVRFQQVGQWIPNAPSSSR